MTSYTCPVCGYPGLAEEPRSEEEGGSYEICSSCGFEFGYTDEDQGYTYESWRERWVAGGMPWRATGIEPPPPGWDPQRQLNDLLGHNGTT
jgi:hypothetical protein